MKKLILILFIILIIPSFGYAGTKVLSKFTVPSAKYVVRVLCVDGYKFVNTNNVVVRKSRVDTADSISTTNSIVQIFEEIDGKSLPAKC